MINHLTEKNKRWCRNLDCRRTSGTSGHHIFPPSLCEYLNVVTLPQFFRVFSHPVLSPSHFFSFSFYLHVSFYYPAFFHLFLIMYLSFCNLSTLTYLEVCGLFHKITNFCLNYSHIKIRAGTRPMFFSGLSLVWVLSLLAQPYSGKEACKGTLLGFPEHLCYGWKGLKCWEEFYLL